MSGDHVERLATFLKAWDDGDLPETIAATADASRDGERPGMYRRKLARSDLRAALVELKQLRERAETAERELARQRKASRDVAVQCMQAMERATTAERELAEMRRADDENIGTEKRPLTKRELRNIGMAVVGPLKYVPERWGHETVVKLYWALMQQKGEAMQARRELAELRERIGEAKVEYGYRYRGGSSVDPDETGYDDEATARRIAAHGDTIMRRYRTDWQVMPDGD